MSATMMHFSGVHSYPEQIKKIIKKRGTFVSMRPISMPNNIGLALVFGINRTHTLKNNVKSSKGGELRILTWANK